MSVRWSPSGKGDLTRTSADCPEIPRGAGRAHCLVISDSNYLDVNQTQNLAPDVVKDIFRQLHDSKRAVGFADGGELDPYRFGDEACRPILEIIDRLLSAAEAHPAPDVR